MTSEDILKLARAALDVGLCFDMAAHITRSTDAEILAFANALLEKERAEAWKPIETAPKDGSVILVGFKPHRRMEGTRRVYEARWNDGAQMFTSVNGFLIFDAATHWMPLPTAPQQ